MLIKLNKKVKDNKSRNKLASSELNRRYYKFMRLISIKANDRRAYIKYQNLLNALPKVRINNLCFITARGRGVLRKFKLSRHQIREKFNYLHGLTNSSW